MWPFKRKPTVTEPDLKTFLLAVPAGIALETCELFDKVTEIDHSHAARLRFCQCVDAALPKFLASKSWTYKYPADAAQPWLEFELTPGEYDQAVEFYRTSESKCCPHCGKVQVLAVGDWDVVSCDDKSKEAKEHLTEYQCKDCSTSFWI